MYLCVCSPSHSLTKFKNKESAGIRTRVICNVLLIDASNTLKAAMKYDGFGNLTLLSDDVLLT